MSTTPRGIYYDEIHPPKFSWGRDSISATRTVKIAWTDIDNFVMEHFPPGVSTSGGNVQQRTLHFPGKPYLLLFNVDVAPFDDENPTTNDANGVATCNNGALVTLEYKTAEFTEGNNGDPNNGGDGEAIIAHALQIGGEYFQLPASSLKWEGETAGAEGTTNQTEDLNAAKLIPTIEWVVTVYRMPALPIDVILDKIGRCNSEHDRNFEARPETLLFLGCNATRKVTTLGTEAWEVEYRFSQRVISWLDRPDLYDPDVAYPIAYAGWNHFIDPRDGTWKKLMTKSNDYIYNTTENFDALFYPDADAEFSSSQSPGPFGP